MTYNEDVLSYEYQTEGHINQYWNCSLYTDLSEEFVREYREHLNWYNISLVQPLTNDFVREFRKEINWTAVIMERKDISWDFKNAWAKELNLNSKIENSLLKWYYVGD